MREVERWLQLGHRGVIIMLRDAQPAWLRPLLLLLESIADNPTITNRAEELLDCEPGALVLLLVRAHELDWLNLNRPLFAQRSLRVVLWADASVSTILKFESPDLHDWISHFVRCPPGVAEFAVEGLRVGSGWWPGVAWRGHGLDLALERVGIEPRTLRPDDAFEELVVALREDLKAPIRWSGVDSLKHLWRVRWALAEARHRGFCVLDGPGVATPGWFPVSSRQDPIGGIDREHLFASTTTWLSAELHAELEPRRHATDGTSAVRDVGLLRHAGPELRQHHESDEVRRWRRRLVRSIRRDPMQLWSRDELAIFASLERDRVNWPSWRGESKQRHDNEHILRSHLNLSEVRSILAIPAAHLDDEELVRHWGDRTKDMLEEALRWGESMWQGDADAEDYDSPAGVMTLIRTMGWDVPGTRRVAARVVRSLLDEPEELISLLAQMDQAIRAELGTSDVAWLEALRLFSLGLALVGVRRQRVEPLEFDGEMPPGWFENFMLEYNVIRILHGRYDEGATLLTEQHLSSDLLRVVIAALLSSGQAERARAELERRTGLNQDPRVYLSDESDPEVLARVYLLKRLSEF